MHTRAAVATFAILVHTTYFRDKVLVGGLARAFWSLRREIEAGRELPLGTKPLFPLSHYLRQPAVLATAFAFFGYAYILYFFLA